MYKAAWFAHLGLKYRFDYWLHRGFLSQVGITLAYFLERGRELLSRHPVTNLTITDLEGQVDALADSDLLQYVPSLTLAPDQIDRFGVIVLMSSPHLRLKKLDLADNAIGDEGAVVLARSSCLGGLQSLELMSTDIGKRGAVALAASTNLRSLTELDLRLNHIGQTGLTALATSANQPSLSRIRVSRVRGIDNLLLRLGRSNRFDVW